MKSSHACYSKNVSMCRDEIKLTSFLALVRKYRNVYTAKNKELVYPILKAISAFLLLAFCVFGIPTREIEG